MPRTLGGLVGFLVMAVVATAVGIWIITRVPPLRALVFGGPQ